MEYLREVKLNEGWRILWPVLSGKEIVTSSKKRRTPFATDGSQPFVSVV
jgi:hypothetical protein